MEDRGQRDRAGAAPTGGPAPASERRASRPLVLVRSDQRLGYRSGEPDGPFAGSWFHQYSWWNDWCQHRFDELWTDEADRVADDLADEYSFHWPWLIGRALITGAT